MWSCLFLSSATFSSSSSSLPYTFVKMLLFFIPPPLKKKKKAEEHEEGAILEKDYSRCDIVLKYKTRAYLGAHNGSWDVILEKPHSAGNSALLTTYMVTPFWLWQDLPKALWVQTLSGWLTGRCAVFLQKLHHLIDKRHYHLLLRCVSLFRTVYRWLHCCWTEYNFEYIAALSGTLPRLFQQFWWDFTS